MDKKQAFYTSFTTSNPRPDLIAPPWAPASGMACGPSANALWGFKYPTPLALKDGNPHVVKIFAITQGIKGNAHNIQLPNETSKSARNIPLRCPAPTLLYNLAAALDTPGKQTENVLFTISPTVTNIGKATTVAPFILRIQIDKKTGTAATGWKYEPGINGDMRRDATIPTGFAVGSSITHDFTGITLSAGEYRTRAIADPDGSVEELTSTPVGG